MSAAANMLWVLLLGTAASCFQVLGSFPAGRDVGARIPQGKLGPEVYAFRRENCFADAAEPS